jgi:hypothetical protein
MIERLDACLATSARATHADGMIGVAFNFFGLDGFHASLLSVDGANRLTLHDADSNAASRAALLAHGADPAFLARHECVFADEQRDELLRLPTAIEDDAGGADYAACFEKLASFH